MSDATVSFKLTGDYSGANKALEETRKGLDALGDQADAANAAMEANAEKMQEAWALVGKELVRTGNFVKQTAKAAQDVAPRGEVLSRWSKLGNVMSGVGSALTVAANTARTVAGYIASDVLAPAMELERSKVQIAAVSGGGERGRAAADFTEKRMRSFAMKGGLEMGPMMEQVRLAAAAGLEYKKAIELVERAWIAAAGREDFATNTIETFVEAMASAGESFAPFVDSLKKSGTDLRPIIAEMTGWDLSGVQEKLDAGRVSVETLLGALREATGESSAAAKAFAEVSETAAAKLQAAKLALEEALLPVAEQLLPVLTRALGDFSEVLGALELPVQQGVDSKHDYGMLHGAGGLIQGALNLGEKGVERLGNGDFSYFNPVSGLGTMWEDFREGLDGYADRLIASRAAGGEKYEPLEEALAGEPLSAEEQARLLPGAGTATGGTVAAALDTAAAALADVAEGIEIAIPDWDNSGVEELMEKVAEVVPTAGEGLNEEESVQRRKGFMRADRWETVHSSLSAVGGGGYSARFRPLKEVGVAEKQLKVQEQMRDHLRELKDKAGSGSGVAILG